MQKTLRGFQAAIEMFRNLDSELPLQQLAMFLAIAQCEGQKSVTELGNDVGLSRASASRNIAALTNLHWKKKPGLGLVQLETDPIMLSRKSVILTAQGKQTIEKLVSILAGSR